MLPESVDPDIDFVSVPNVCPVDKRERRHGPLRTYTCVLTLRLGYIGGIGSYLSAHSAVLRIYDELLASG